MNTRLLKATLQMSKLELSKEKTQDLLRKVRVENKALRAQIAKLQNEAVHINGQEDKKSLAQIFLDEKEKEIHVLKKKLKIPSTQLIQTNELAEFEKEKETLNTELTDCKAKLLKLKEKERQWEVDTKLLKERKKELKAMLAQRKKSFRKNA